MKFYFLQRDYEHEKGRRSLMVEDETIGRWQVSAFKKSEEDAALRAFLRGLEIGIRKAHADMSKRNNEVMAEFSRDYYKED